MNDLIINVSNKVTQTLKLKLNGFNAYLDLKSNISEVKSIIEILFRSSEVPVKMV